MIATVAVDSGRPVREALAGLIAGHGQLLLAAIQAYQRGKSETSERLRQQVEPLWAQPWSSNYAALKLVQARG